MKKSFFIIFSVSLAFLTQAQAFKSSKANTAHKSATIKIAAEESDLFTITKTMMDSDTNDLTLGGNPVAFLTSGIVDSRNGAQIDPADNGWLRLTSDSEYQRGYAVVNQSFPSTLGVRIDFEFKTWRTDPTNQGADGLSIFLFDAATDTFKIGGFGGSLGYAQYKNFGAEQSDGLSNGYVGIGLDEFGNYSKGSNNGDNVDNFETEGRIGGPGFNSNSIGVRGPAPDYRWLTGNFKLNFKLNYEDANRTMRPSDDVFFRRIQIDITPGKGLSGDQYSIKAKIKTSKDGNFENVLDEFILPTIPPEMLKLGFAASTGYSVNYHEIRNLSITNVIDIQQSIPSLYGSNVLFNVSPNPFNEKITMELPTGEIIEKVEIYNLLGECVYQTFDNNRSLRINGADNVYFLKVKTASGINFNAKVLRKK